MIHLGDPTPRFVIRSISVNLDVPGTCGQASSDPAVVAGACSGGESCDCPSCRPADPAQRLGGRGVPADLAARWGRPGGRRRATLWSAEVCGAGAGVHLWEVHRAVAAQRTVVGWSRGEAGDLDDTVLVEVLSALLGRIVEEARVCGATLVKVEEHPGDTLIAQVASRLGFQPMPTPPVPASPESMGAGNVPGGWALRCDGAEFDWGRVPDYERQQSDFTCGPATAIMALSRTDARVDGHFDVEMDWWRRGTYTFGCGHFGLAGVIAEAGGSVEVRAEVEGPVVGTAVGKSMLTPQMRQRIHEGHRARALDLGVGEKIAPMGVDELVDHLDEGRSLITLVDLLGLNGEDTPHWVLAWGRIGDTVLVHDPWCDEEFGESWVETAAMPVPVADLWSAAAWAEGEGPARRAVLVIG